VRRRTSTRAKRLRHNPRTARRSRRGKGTGHHHKSFQQKVIDAIVPLQHFKAVGGFNIVVAENNQNIGWLHMLPWQVPVSGESSATELVPIVNEYLTPDPNERVFVKNQSAIFKICNMGNTQLNVQLYRLRYKRSCQADAEETAPTTIWNVSENKEGNTAANMCNYPNQPLPNRHDTKWGAWIRSKKLKSWHLDPGMQVNWKHHVKMNRFISPAQMSYDITDDWAIVAGMTETLMWVVNTQPVGTNGDLTAQPALGQGKLSIVYTVSTKLKVVHDNRTISTIMSPDALYALGSPLAPNERIIVDETGASAATTFV